MKLRIIILAIALYAASCENSGSKTETADSTNINIENGNVSGGGPNNGMGDTMSYDRMNNKIRVDTTSTDTIPKR